MRVSSSLVWLGLGCSILFGACGGSKGGGYSTFVDGGADGSSSGSGSGGSSGAGSSSGSLVGDGSTDDEGGLTGDPTTCAEAESSHSYIGCDYWPTVTANVAWSIFDFAAVVANAGANTANITVTGPGNVNQTATVAPGSLAKIYLPWVKPLKGADMDSCGAATAMPASILAYSSAYHLVSSVPVTVYQFSALEYSDQGGPTGKDWSTCPGTTTACPATEGGNDQPIGCYSYTNDASLLLPSTAMTGNYRVTGHGGWGPASIGAVVAITATANGTTVNMKVSSTGQVIAGGGITATGAGGTLTLNMNAGDVAELVGGPTDAIDLSGSLIQATKPVQVITGLPCLDVPDTAEACDHVEESNFPAETLGDDYIVARPTGPKANAVGQVVRIYGNVDNTTLTYEPSAPAACPTTINAGQVATCGVVAQDFEVKGSGCASPPCSFAVGIFTQGASVVDPTTQPPNQQGDPDQSLPAAVKQYRTKYVFLAPTDYEDNYAVVIAPTGTSVTLDGAPVTATPTAIGTTGFGILRLTLQAGNNAGAHVLTASNPVGLQVMGYGSYTSYMYPGGLDLAFIAPPPAN
jgi:hypothetical protein